MWPFHVFARTERWLPAAVAALCWALAAGGALLWWLHAPSGPAAPLGAVAERAPAQVAAQTPAVLRALGHTAAEAEPAGDAQRRFVLLGVVAGASGQGAALLAVDGQPPQAFVQGQRVAEGWRVDSLSAKGVRLAAAGVAPLQLTLPER
ncbi:MAG: hypothetical protein RL559_1407 [Pseudomonadota bacterium]